MRSFLNDFLECAPVAGPAPLQLAVPGDARLADCPVPYPINLIEESFAVLKKIYWELQLYKYTPKNNLMMHGALIFIGGNMLFYMSRGESFQKLF